MNISYIRWLSKHGKIKEDKKKVVKNYRAVARAIKSYAREGHRFAYYRSHIEDENVERLRQEGFQVRFEAMAQSSRWEIKW